MEKRIVKEMVADMDEETEEAFIEEILKKRVARLRRRSGKSDFLDAVDEAMNAARREGCDSHIITVNKAEEWALVKFWRIGAEEDAGDD